MSLFRDSRINERMENLGEWCIFGDSAYRHHSRTHSYGVDGDFNGKMKSVRISIEWNYGTTASLFTFIGMKRKFKVYETAGVARIYIVATVLKKIPCMPVREPNDELLQRCPTRRLLGM